MRILREKKITSRKRRLQARKESYTTLISLQYVLFSVFFLYAHFPLPSPSFTLPSLQCSIFNVFPLPFLPPFSVLFSVFFLYAHFPLPSPSPPSNVLFSMFFLYPFCLPPMFYSQCFSFTLPSEVYYCECHICSVKYFPGDQEGNT